MDEHCNGCGQNDRCQEVYEKLGRSKGPDIALKAVMAFVVPVAVFVIAALITQALLKNKIENVRLMVLIQSVVGLVSAGIVVLILRRFNRRSISRHTECPEEEKQ